MSFGALLRRLGTMMHRRLPRREELAQNKWLAPVAGRALSPELWRFTRRSVPRGVALGLFAAFIIPIGQIFLACFLAFPARANVAVAALVTFVTNPFTLPFWIVVANRIGQFFIGTRAEDLVAHSAAGTSAWTQDVDWMAHSAGQAVVGFIVLAIVSSCLGYVIAGWTWRYWIGHKHRERRLRPKLRADVRANGGSAPGEDGDGDAEGS